MAAVADDLRADLRKLWDFLREATGDDAYERYVERHRLTHAEVPALSREEFFRSEQERKWSGVNRCC